MQTLYIDVYFLINFSVDLLSIYFSVRINKIAATTVRIIICALIGALQAVLYILFFESSLYGAIFSLLYFSLISLFISRRTSVIRRIKFTGTFCLLQILIGGSVYYVYQLFDRYFDFGEESLGVENRKLLIGALMVLLSVGVLKLALVLFTSSKIQKSAKLVVVYSGEEILVECMVDSGNFAIDPIDRTPVVFFSRSLFKRVFKTSSLPNDNFKNLLRIIPVKRGKDTVLYYGIKYKDTYILKNGAREKIDVVIAIDNENNFAGYGALIPFSVVME